MFLLRVQVFRGLVPDEAFDELVDDGRVDAAGGVQRPEGLAVAVREAHQVPELGLRRQLGRARVVEQVPREADGQPGD